MDPSLWQHQTVAPTVNPMARDPMLNAFASGVLVGIVLVATVILWRRSGSTLGARRRPIGVVSGWGDLVRLVGSVIRGGLWLIGVLLLLGRIVFWPAGRRW